MKYSLRSLFLVVLAISLVLGWIANHSWVEDRVAIEGTWQPTMARRGLQNIGDHILEQERWTIQDGKFTKPASFQRNRKIVSGSSVVEVRLDSTKSPKRIDAVVVAGPNLGYVERGIYELDDDHLKVCWGGATRPRKFEWKEDDLSLYLVTYKRVQETFQPSKTIAIGPKQPVAK